MTRKNKTACLTTIGCCVLSLLTFNIAIAQSIEKVPLTGPTGFIENKGQFLDQSGNQRADLLYLYLRDGIKVQLLPNTISFDLYTMEEEQLALSEATGAMVTNRRDAEDAPLPDVKFKSSRIDLQFEGANEDPQIIAGEPLPDVLHYYLAHTPEDGIRDVQQYNTITYKNLYDRIDLVMIANPPGYGMHAMAYDFVVHPGGNANDIRYRYHGVSEQHLLENGTLASSNVSGNLFEMIPESYLMNDDGIKGQAVDVSFRKESNFISFEVPLYDRRQKLVIDPLLVWATYCGGIQSDEARGLAVDSEDHVIITGRTFSTENIATTGAYQTELLGDIDILIEKYTSEGVRMWGTYYGGEGLDRARACIVTEAEDIYIGAHTTSTDGCVTEFAYQKEFSGVEDGLLAFFSKDGYRIWATYYGGEGEEVIRRLHLDTEGNIVMVGYTHSDSSIATNDAWQQQRHGGSDVCLSKWTPDGDLIWSTYLGGESEDHGRSVITDINNNIYINGSTGSKFGIKKNAFRPNNSGGQDYLLAKYSPTGSLKWCSYWGGEIEDRGRGVYVDGAGEFVYFIGYSACDTGVTTIGAFQETWSPGYDNNGMPYHDAVIMKWSTNGYPIWSTYIGGPPDDRGRAVTMIGDDVYLAGTTSSTTVIATADGFQPEFGGKEDMFIEKFDKTGERIWGSYFGAGQNESTLALAVDNKGENIFMVGTTSSTSGIATPGVAQENFGGYDDALLLKINVSGMVSATQPDSASSISIYPNPSRGSFMLNYNHDAAAILRMYDLHGKEVHIQSVPAFEKSILVDNLELIPGIYEMVISTDKEEHARSKIIIMK